MTCKFLEINTSHIEAKNINPIIVFYIFVILQIKLKFNKITILEHQNQINNNLKRGFENWHSR